MTVVGSSGYVSLRLQKQRENSRRKRAERLDTFARGLVREFALLRQVREEQTFKDGRSLVAMRKARRRACRTLS